MNRNGRGERNADFNNVNLRLGAHYDRYNPNELQEFNDQTFNRNNYQRVFDNENNTQLSVSQEPDLQYSKIDYYLKVSSADRDSSVYPCSSNFMLELPKEYKNIYSIELIQAIIPDQNNVKSEPYLLLSIDELDKKPVDAIDKSTSDSFAILLLNNPPLVPGTFISIDNTIHQNTVLYYPTTPKAKLSKMSIKITDVDGNIFDFGGDGTTTKGYQSTFVFKIVQLERNTNVMSTRNVY